MRRSYKYRIYPNSQQREALDAQFGFIKFLYNCALQERISYYRRYGKGLSYNLQAGELPDIKEYFPESQNLHSQVLQQVLKQVDVAYKNFFNKLKKLKPGEKAGFPRFKGRTSKMSLCFPQTAKQFDGKGGAKIIKKRLFLTGIESGIMLKLHRPWEGDVKQARIQKNSSGEYYLILSCDNVLPKTLSKTGKVIGIDLGITNFLTMDDGTTFHHPDPSRDRLKNLQHKAQNKRDHKAKNQKPSNNLIKAQRAVAREYEHLTNIKEDFQHKLANKLVRENDEIIFEKLNIKSMLASKGFEASKENIAKASWGTFINMILYKAESAGKKVIFVNPRNTSKTCSACSKIHFNQALHDRVMQCDCGFKMDRDQNAAINILHLGMASMQKLLGTSNLKPK